MDEKLKSVLENEELLAKIVAAVKGTEQREQASPAVRETAPAVQGGGADAVALLAALKPFLRRERREKLDAVTRALSAASIYKSIKNA